jgi:hypothetical protein
MLMGLGELGCAALSGMLCRAPCHPLDTIKTVAFTDDGSGHQYGFRRGFREVVKREGVKGLYRGWGIATIGSAPGVGAYLTAYDLTKNKFEAMGCGSTALCHLTAGFFAEATSCVFWVPIDVIKERLQSQHPNVKGRYVSSLDGLMTCLKNERLQGLYKGYFSTLASFGPFSAVYFMSYEKFNKWIEPMGYSTFVTGLLAGGLGNAVAALVTNPLELVKTRLQVQRAILTIDGVPQRNDQFRYNYKGFVDGLSSLLKEKGVLGLQRGVVSRMMYTVPNAALTMATFHWLKETLLPGSAPSV